MLMQAKLITAIISALWMMESSRAVTAPNGRGGEVGPMQVKWPFVEQVNKGLDLNHKFVDADRSDLFKSKLIVATWLKQKFSNLGQASVYDIALEYRCGKTGMLKANQEQIKYAKEVARLVNEEMENK